MTEAEWRAGDGLERIIDFLWSKVSDRKLRLIACGCCRLVWNSLTNRRSREAVEVSEQFADGMATPDALASAAWRAEGAVFAVDEKRERYDDEQKAIQGGWLRADDAAEDPFLAGVDRSPIPLDSARLAAVATELATGDPGSFLQQVDRSIFSLAVVRDVTGNPFHPIAFDPAWRTSTAVAIATQMYESRDFSAMPIFADALQDAGCDNDDILNHCRGANAPHVRGCWVVDLALGKE